ncbi:MAG: hypothetical protein KBC98_02385 [Candidatus Pacebacteria bacterium]|nr:hypothetical protein [Candidatus Paceibacterota bacterium]
MLQAFILTANRGTKLDHGSVQYVEIPVGTISHLSLNWLRPYVIVLVGITTSWFLWELFAWKFSVSLATGVPEKVFHAGVNFAQALLLCMGIYFLSCEKRRRKFFDYTIFAH